MADQLTEIKRSIEEAKAGELLDQALQARADWGCAEFVFVGGCEEEGPEHEEAEEREEAAVAALLALDSTAPGVALAQFVAAARYCDDALCTPAGDRLDFAGARREHHGGTLDSFLCDYLVRMERTCASGPVAAVLAKHRARMQAQEAEPIAAE